MPHEPDSGLHLVTALPAGGTGDANELQVQTQVRLKIADVGRCAAGCRHTAEMQPVARWLTPSAADIGADALPSMAYPSDHLACLVTLQWA